MKTILFALYIIAITTSQSNHLQTHPQVMSIDCLHTVNSSASKQFNLTACSMTLTTTQFSINMTYTVINDAAGAAVNKIVHQSGYLNSYSQIVVNLVKNQTLSGMNHHVGELIYSRQVVSLSKIHFLKDGTYYWMSNLCCNGCLTTSVCSMKHYSTVPFNVKRGMIELQSQLLQQ